MSDGERKYDLTYLSLGAGVQSSALLIASNKGLWGVPRYDVALFADTGDEPGWVYDNLRRLSKWSEIPVRTVGNGRLSRDLLLRINGDAERAATIPAFVADSSGGSAPLKRNCSADFKTRPIETAIRVRLGYKSKERVRSIVRNDIGYSLDEVSRCSPSRVPWIVRHFPLIEARKTRQDCAALTEQYGFSIVGKSACVFCPFHGDKYWLELKTRFPDEFRRAVEFDRKIRDMTRAGVKNPAYLHRSLKPLDEVKFRHEGQLSMWDEECSGVCGV